ncbi:MAG: nucleotidyltransferase family protein [Candidatus Sungbacteria bacterium]|nr:nucleotidyltransferase family protein [Candidatus Sungbacteria bacterium]
MTIDEIKKKAVPILKKAGITRSSVFGSIARGEGSAESDVDLLVEFQGKKTLLDLAGLQQELERALGRSVDLITRRSVYPALKKHIEPDAVSIL